MTYLSVIEKLNILFDTMMDFYFILVFSVLLMVFTFMYITKKITIKKYSLLMLLSFAIVFGISIISNYEVLSNTFDNFTTIFFGNIYFPSIYVYVGVLVICFIAFIISIFNVMLNKIYKIINSIMFVVNNVLFVVILNIIAKNEIDVFSVQSLYSNTNLVAVLELSMGLFILWIIGLIVVYTTNIIYINFSSRKINKKDIKEEDFSPVLEVSMDNNLDVNMLNGESLESVFVEETSNVREEKIELSEIIEDDIQDKIIVDNNIHDTSLGVTFNDILNGTIPVTYYENEYINNEYDLVDPQNVYENNYNKIKGETSFNDILFQSGLEESKFSVKELTKTENDKDEVRYATNVVSLNELNSVENNNYSVDDYKKIIKMLTEVKNHANGTNINIDDAVAIGLINNYSIDDCMKFKNILENNLN